MKKELSEEGLVSIDDMVLPHIRHWDRLAILIRDRAIAPVTLLPLALGVSTLTIVTAIVVVTPIYLSVEAYNEWEILEMSFRRFVTRHQNSHILNTLDGRESQAPQGGDGHEGDNDDNYDGRDGQGTEAVQDGHKDEGVHGGGNITD
ncbi:hypothetical protein J3R82DRAFT_11041 [Butyriboletus roseoflavus]|nr:hypothetical protein J3R82DRAFT_11041 [Butyriboletus roseoflavus]